MPSFEKGGGSHNSHEMRLSGILGMSLLISPSLQTYTGNIGISRGSIPMYLTCFGSLWPVIPQLFGVGKTLDFVMLTHYMLIKVKVSKERMSAASKYE